MQPAQRDAVQPLSDRLVEDVGSGMEMLLLQALVQGLGSLVQQSSPPQPEEKKRLEG